MLGKFFLGNYGVEEVFWGNLFFLAEYLISRSSTCLDNHEKGVKFWSDTKLQAQRSNHERKLTVNSAKAFKYMSRVVCQMQN